jgi:hypothetical protein
MNIIIIIINNYYCFNIIKGFNRVYLEMPEICIDVPLAYNILEKFALKCEQQGFFPTELLKNIPSRFQSFAIIYFNSTQIQCFLILFF